MSKYVAFLDILGFKKKLQQLGQDAAKQYISAFSATAYHEWEQLQPKLVEGLLLKSSALNSLDNSTGCYQNWGGLICTSSFPSDTRKLLHTEKPRVSI